MVCFQAVFGIVAVLASGTAGLGLEGAVITDHPYFSSWNSFKALHGKTYSNMNEELMRFGVFVSNVLLIEGHNSAYKAGKETFHLAMNKFGDLTSAEFRALRNGFKVPASRKLSSSEKEIFELPENTSVPDSVDWRKEGYVTEIKDQGMCGSCWAFSATGSLEGQHYKKTGKLVSLSEQNLVDCDVDGEDEGCNGGYMDAAFDYVKKNNGIDTEKSYPYEGWDRRCRFKQETVGAVDSGIVDIPEGNETALVEAVGTVGPISVAIDASSFQFQFYHRGVYYNRGCSSRYLDHGVLAVGYGEDENGKKYYIVKNSWGDSWGDNGYILMSRDKKNNCGIATMASYPKV